MLQTIEINPEVSARASVIWLHGLGADGHDFVDIIPQLNLPEDLGVRFIFPHAPERAITYAGGIKLRAWFDIDKIAEDGVEDEVGIRASEKLIIQLIEKELVREIPSNKIVLAGFSQGGAMALQCGLRYVRPLAGILVLSAWLPLSSTVAGEKNSENQNTPILMLHGTNDPLVPIAWAEKGFQYLQKNGHDVTMDNYFMQHTVCDEEIVAIGQWLEKILG